MNKPNIPLARYEIAAYDNPRHPRENALGYIHRLAVIAGGVAPDDEGIMGPKRKIPSAPKQPAPATPPTEADEYADVEVPF